MGGPGTQPAPAAVLVLEDGAVFRGETFAGGAFTVAGEVVFNTAMSGYQEVLTDPSYRRQIVCMAAPQMGNYGVNDADAESGRLQAAGFLVRQAARRPSNWRAQRTLAEELTAAGVPGVEGIDTRRLVRHLRTHGSLRGALSNQTTDTAALRAVALAAPDPNGLDVVSEVTRAEPVELEPTAPERYRVVLYDFGAKRNIDRQLRALGARVLIVPAGTPPADALAWRPDGVMMSNGPGDPATCLAGVRATRGLLGQVPVFGICLGQQLLGQAAGGRTLRLKFGHRGINQPVVELATGQVTVTSHNHGFAVDPDTLPATVRVTHRNANDGVVEGIECTDVPAFSVQYHPEAAPGPHDAHPLFRRFADLMDACRSDAYRAAPTRDPGRISGGGDPGGSHPGGSHPGGNSERPSGTGRAGAVGMDPGVGPGGAADVGLAGGAGSRPGGDSGVGPGGVTGVGLAGDAGIQPGEDSGVEPGGNPGMPSGAGRGDVVGKDLGAGSAGMTGVGLAGDAGIQPGEDSGVQPDGDPERPSGTGRGGAVRVDPGVGPGGATDVGLAGDAGGAGIRPGGRVGARPGVEPGGDPGGGLGAGWGGAVGEGLGAEPAFRAAGAGPGGGAGIRPGSRVEGRPGVEPGGHSGGAGGGDAAGGQEVRRAAP